MSFFTDFYAGSTPGDRELMDESADGLYALIQKHFDAATDARKRGNRIEFNDAIISGLSEMTLLIDRAPCAGSRDSQKPPLAPPIAAS